MLSCVVANKCSDGLKSPGETGVDCGGLCVSMSMLCPVGSGCRNDTDCSGAACGVNNTCAGEYSVIAERSSLLCCHVLQLTSALMVCKVQEKQVSTVAVCACRLACCVLSDLAVGTILTVVVLRVERTTLVLVSILL